MSALLSWRITDYLGGDTSAAIGALIILWSVFVGGVSVGIWLGYTWYRRMRKWADGLEISDDRCGLAGCGVCGGLFDQEPEGLPGGRGSRYPIHRGLGAI